MDIIHLLLTQYKGGDRASQIKCFPIFVVIKKIDSHLINFVMKEFFLEDFVY